MLVHTHARAHTHTHVRTHTAYLSENETIPCKMAIAHKSLKLSTCKGLHYHTYKISTLSSKIPLAIHMRKIMGVGWGYLLAFLNSQRVVSHTVRRTAGTEKRKKGRKRAKENVGIASFVHHEWSSKCTTVALVVLAIFKNTGHLTGLGKTELMWRHVGSSWEVNGYECSCENCHSHWFESCKSKHAH